MSDNIDPNIPPNNEEEEGVTGADIVNGIEIARRRFLTLAKDPDLSPKQVLSEIAETVLPLLGDELILIDRLESFAEWASDEINDMDDPDEESQLLPEDAVRYANFFQAIYEQCEGSIGELDPESTQYKGLELMRDEAKALLAFTNEITLVPRSPGPDEDEDEDEDEDDPKDRN